MMMAQYPAQFQRPLLRIGSIVFLAGVIIAVVSTVIHPSTEDPSNHPLVFAKYARNDSWIAVHIVSLCCLLAQSESNMASILSWIGLVLAIITASAFAVLQAVDGRREAQDLM
jgi:hypothetical protein